MATDDFNRADNADLGANWTIQSGQAALQIVSNRAVPSNNFSDCGEIWVADSFSDDQYSESVVTALHSSAPAETGIGPIVRGSTSVASYYAVVVNSTAANPWTLAKRVTGTYSDLHDGLDLFANGDTVRLEVSGTTLTVKRNGSTIYTTTDPSVTTGRPGIWYSSAASDEAVDSWAGGDLVTAAITQLPKYAPIPFMSNQRI